MVSAGCLPVYSSGESHFLEETCTLLSFASQASLSTLFLLKMFNDSSAAHKQPRNQRNRKETVGRATWVPDVWLRAQSTLELLQKSNNIIN